MSVKYKTLFFVLITYISVFPQISFSSDELIFPQTFVHQTDSVSLKIFNQTDNAVSIEWSFAGNSERFSSGIHYVSVPQNDSAEVFFRYSPIHNIEDKSSIFIYNIDTTIFAVIKLSGSGKFVDSYYNSTFNLYDTQLKQALTTLTSGHTSLGYNSARDKMFMEIDNKKVNGQGALQNTLECVYTGREAVGYTSRTDAQTNFSFNTEHSWPQSTFNQDEPMRSDLYHLFPTDETANGIRGNLPFGKVVSSANWQVGGSKRGYDSTNQLVFEPRDVHKGNLARGMFYFLTRYPQNYGGFFSARQEKTFRQWNLSDTVDTAEMNRNNKIATFQGKRNPYIDHPEFADRIYSFLGTARPSVYAAEVYPMILKFDSTAVGDTSAMNLYIVNTGNSEMLINQLTVQLSNFNVNTYDHSILPGMIGKINILFIPDTSIDYTSNITINFNNQVLVAKLTGIGKTDISGVNVYDEKPAEFLLAQNYPNPFNPSTRIEFYTPKESSVQLLIYSITGQLIKTVVDENMERGFHQVNFNGEGFASGVYFYVLKSGNFYQSKSMLLLK
ncbi:MAG: endonuclease [Ignavibacteriaceae bacterium]|nr:endonuclease [Ignavibacteriaceae bacterium]